MLKDNSMLSSSSINPQRMSPLKKSFLLYRKHTTSLPSTISKASPDEAIAFFFSDKVSSPRLKISSNPSPIPPHSNPSLTLKVLSSFLLHLLMKLLNACMPFLIDSLMRRLRRWHWCYCTRIAVSSTVQHHRAVQVVRNISYTAYHSYRSSPFLHHLPTATISRILWGI